MNIMNMMLLCMMITSILMAICMSLEKKISNSKESLTNFECGFDSLNKKSKMIPSQFFSIAILFLIFDVEIGFIIPIPLSEVSTINMNWSIIMIMMIFLLSTILEWKMGMIEWMK
uniref:NADH-ubiquinone oxidoreductase chain 3 n=1 Tax=Arrenurus rostratus TaxID=3136836 RepID=A0AAU6QEC3_9ACAR